MMDRGVNHADDAEYMDRAKLVDPTEYSTKHVDEA